AGCVSAGGATSSSSFGFIQKASTEPKSNSTMLPRNGNSQLPVLSMIKPPITGETIAAKAEPTFIKPLADPENRGVMSIGIAHMGPMVNSEKKNAPLRQRA